jgi:hypothetical protein
MAGDVPLLFNLASSIQNVADGYALWVETQAFRRKTRRSATTNKGVTPWKILKL